MGLAHQIRLQFLLLAPRVYHASFDANQKSHQPNIEDHSTNVHHENSTDQVGHQHNHPPQQIEAQVHIVAH
jgi:hypothetical protein